MTSYDATQVPSNSPAVDITSLLRSWCSPRCIDKITMAHVRLDMIAVDSIVQPRLDRIKELESEIARLRAEVDVVSPSLDKYHSFHAPIRCRPPEVLLSIFSHLGPGPLPLKDDVPWVLKRVCPSWRDLVMHTSRLWSTIRAEWGRRWNLFLDLESTLTLLACPLRYSNRVPLDITLLTSPRMIPSFDRIANQLRQHSNRWCSRSRF
ncbi:hypothetical protein ARMGADRAFT_1093644 [Armillaria gallica]|uniref:Uncharacterized protein n=1 Tax=Armillaria gallica TaxID=47427 RepID=A0A2H3CQB1_ARMGA|nr:hypothetical protein ARMGADRAFT_1093644 [Armillaria gallica]